ncbi:chemotaxis protein CheA [Candidatus Epulonipiscioides saccharophilum]|nr:chemotaxis protein CheA [Epulopiscium sp. SCG-B10WGA-EpuloB]
MDMSQYLQIFIEESKENLQALNENLLLLEATPDDIEVVNVIFRVAHTLKGMAGTMGFAKMQLLTHSVENVLSEIRNGKLHITTEMVDIMFQCLDALENYVDQIINTSAEGEESYSNLIEQLEAILKGDFKGSNSANPASQATVAPQAQQGSAQKVSGSEKKTEKAVANSSSNKIKFPESVEAIKNHALESGINVFKLNITLATTCMLKAARAFIVYSDLGAIGEIIYGEPSSQEIEEEKFEQEFMVVITTDEPAPRVEAIVLSVAEIEKVVVEELTLEQEDLPEPVAQTKTPEPSSAPAQKPVAAQNKKPDAPSKPPTKEEAVAAHKAAVAGKSVRVNIDRLDTLMNLVSELIIVKTQLEGITESTSTNSETNYSDSVEYLERVTTSLHDAVMKVRMVPVETVFNRFPRLIRDISRKLGKNIELIMSGEETELDRTVIDEIGDPLIHLLRNAADHGLETTKERLEVDKPEKGTIKLRAYQDGNSVVIEVEDDGRGINIEKIRSKAIERGESADVVNAMSDQEVLDLLFKPSFSMAKQITDLSGRGVGLDVVKSKITALGGNVEIVTELSKGSRFIVRLPLTLAIIQALMVNISSEKYAIPLNNIQNIENIHHDEIKQVQNQEVIVLRNQVIPVVRLDTILELPSTDTQDLIVVIVRKGEKQVGFVVDSLIGQQEIVIKPLGKYLNNIHMIAGATILGNGEVALILDINTLV